MSVSINGGLMATGAGEQRVSEALDRMVDEGQPRLHRSTLALLATAALGGIDVGVGILALLAVRHATGSDMLAGVAFSIGLIALLLAHSELFTEGFLVPVTVVAAGGARLVDLVRMWALVLLGNLAGGWVFLWIVMRAFPELHETATAAGDHFIRAGFDLRTFCLAVLGGGVITLMTRMQNGTDDVPAKIVAAVGTAFVLAGLRLWHSVLDSLVAFAGLQAGHAPYGYGQWAVWLAWAVLGNMVGGLGLTTMLRLLRSAPLIIERRQSPGNDGRVGREDGEPVAA